MGVHSIPTGGLVPLFTWPIVISRRRAEQAAGKLRASLLTSTQETNLRVLEPPLQSLNIYSLFRSHVFASLGCERFQSDNLFAG